MSDVKEQFVVEADLEPLTEEIAKGNKTIQTMEKRLEGLEAKLKLIVRTSDTTRNSAERLTSSWEKQNNVMGKTPLERLILDHERLNKRLSGNVEMINRSNVAFGEMKTKMEAAAKSSEGMFSSGSPGALALRSMKDLAEGRVGYGMVTGGSALAGMTGMVAVLSGVTIGLGALGIASVSAMHSLADLGVQTRDAQLRLGMSAKQVGEFSFAAKAVGQDISVFERGMRGLTQAVEDQTNAGDKARSWLTKFGVDIRGLRDGSASTSDTFEQIAEGLSRINAPLERNKALLDVFKKVGIEIIPVFERLQENLAKAREYGFGLSDEEEKKFLHYKDQLTLIDAMWERIWRHAKEHLADLASGVIDAFTSKEAQSGATYLPNGTVHTPSRAPTGAAAGLIDTTVPMPAGPSGDIGRAAYQRLLDASKASDARAVSRYESSLGVANKLKEAEKELGKLGDIDQYSTRQQVQEMEIRQHRVDSLRAEVKLLDQKKAVTEELRKLQVGAADLAAHPFGMLAAERQLMEFSQRPAVSPADVARARATLAPQLANERQKRDDKFADEDSAQRVTMERELLRVKQSSQAEIPVRDLGKDGTTALDVEKSIDAQYAQRATNAAESREKELGFLNARAVAEGDIDGKHARALAVQGVHNAETVELAKADADWQKQIVELHDKDREKTLAFNEAMSKIQAGDKVSEVKHSADLAARIAELKFHGENPAAGIKAEFAIRKQEAQDVYDLTIKRIADEEKGDQAKLSNAQALKDLHDQDRKAAEEANFKLQQMHQQQLEAIKDPASGLWNTLFTKPKEFGSQLGSTLKAAVLKPITSGLGEMTANALHPLIFGRDGQGGISGALHGIFGGASRGISDVQLVNGAVPVVIMGAGGGSSGGGAASGGGAFNRAGFSQLAKMGLSLPLAAAMAMGSSSSGSTGGDYATSALIHYGDGSTENAGGGTGSFGSSMNALGSIAGIGGTGGFAGGYGGPGGGSQGGGGVHARSSAGNPLSGLLGGFKGSLSELKSSFGIGGALVQGVGNTAHFGGTSMGSVLSSEGAGGLYLAAGLPIAMAGIAGSHRGTAAGVGLSTLGGALTGAGIGTMIFPGVGTAIGAGIGALAGFGIGLGEVIAGVETPERQAARLIRSIYGLNINANSTTIKQVVAMAKQSYGGNVSIAVRSPQVRELLQLYADSTGQKSSLLASQQVHSASLAESGGALYQQATYQNGTPYTYASSLPTLGPSGGQIPTSYPGGGSTTISLNQQQTVDLWRTGTTAAINGNSRGVAQSALNGNGASATRLGSAGLAADPGAIWA